VSLNGPRGPCKGPRGPFKRTPGSFSKDPGILLKGPGVLLKDGPRGPFKGPGVDLGRKSRERRAENFQPDCIQVPRKTLNKGVAPLLEGFPGRRAQTKLLESDDPRLAMTRGPHRWPHPPWPRPKNRLKGWLPEGSLPGDFRPSSPWIFGRNRPPGPPRSPGPASHIHLHEKSGPQTNPKAKWRRRKETARLPSSTQLKNRLRTLHHAKETIIS